MPFKLCPYMTPPPFHPIASPFPQAVGGRATGPYWESVVQTGSSSTARPLLLTPAWSLLGGGGVSVLGWELSITARGRSSWGVPSSYPHLLMGSPPSKLHPPPVPLEISPKLRHPLA